MTQKLKTKKPGRKKEVVEKYMLANLIAKYKKNESENDIPEVVYKLSFAGKFIIIKGKTLVGSLSIIADTFDYFTKNKDKYKNHLYVHLYNHYIKHKGMRFTVRILAKKDSKTGQFELLKREQMELDKNRFNPLCLNNATEPYIPVYNEFTYKYGWLDKQPVMSFKSYQTSKARTAYLKRFCS